MGDDDDVFCEADGTRLTAELSPVASSNPAGLSGGAASTTPAPRPSRPSTADATLSVCGACEALEPDAGDGYCRSCGARLTHAAPGLLAPGARLGGLVVTSARAVDELVAVDSEAAVAPVTVLLGHREVLELEAKLLEALSSVTLPATLPRVLSRGDDARHGAYLVLTAPPPAARPLGGGLGAVDPAGAIALLERVVELARAVERAGRGWEPLAADVHVDPDGGLHLSRLRCPKILGRTQRLDARVVLEAFGAPLLPEPIVRGPPALVRAVLPHAASRSEQERTLDAAARLLGAARAELDAPSPGAPIGAVCDAGMRRERNEDAFAVAEGEGPWAVLVVCDGVSASTKAEQASTVASKVARDALAHFAASGDIAHEAASRAMLEAIRAAHVAVCAHHVAARGVEPPGTTIVAGLVWQQRLTVGWVGDSRAYWVSPTGAELLTSDHSWVTEVVARGQMSEDEAMRAPLAHALTRCLGPLESSDEPDASVSMPEVRPDVRARDLPAAGHVILCSDGLWNYFPRATDLATLVRSAGPSATPAQIARVLMNHALVRGGQDNVTVVVYAVGDRAEPAVGLSSP